MADEFVTANEVWGKVIFSQARVIPSVHIGGGWVGERGGGCLPSMHHRSHDQGVLCIRGVGGWRYASYWNAFLFSCKITC